MKDRLQTVLYLNNKPLISKIISYFDQRYQKLKNR